MIVDLALAVSIWLVSFGMFGRFVAPRWKVGGKLVFYLVIAWGLSAWIGHWSLIWIVGHPALGMAGHAWWCRRHGINWITCRPRARYLALRPWAIDDGFEPPAGSQNADA